MSDDPINWFAVMTEAVAKVNAGLYQSTPRRSRDDLIALACAEAVENRLPITTLTTRLVKDEKVVAAAASIIRSLLDAWMDPDEDYESALNAGRGFLTTYRQDHP
jgi:hypothetical protein